MMVTNKDVKNLGINYIETDTVGNVVALKGKLPSRHVDIVINNLLQHRFSFITDKIIYWAEFELDYCGG